MSVIGIIPVRIKSSRLPNKPMKRIENIPMLEHVYYRSKLSSVLDEIYIATCDSIIKKYAESIGAKVIMTSKNHKRATDRIYEAFTKISKDKRSKVKKIVMIQGDEPMLNPVLIDALVDELSDTNIEIATVAGMKLNAKDLNDTNTVKVLLDRDRFAVNFRREPVETEAGGYYHHMGIYAYKKATLERFVKLKVSENEEKLKLEQYRALDNDIPIKVILTEKVLKGIDTMDDLKQFKAG